MTTAEHNYRESLARLSMLCQALADGTAPAKYYADQHRMMRAQVKNIGRRYRAVVREQEQSV